jgi:hypothetical protein
MIELYLSSDGKHTVHVTAETREQMEELAPYARSLYERVLKQYGTKPQMWEAARSGQGNGHVTAEKRSTANGAASHAGAPLCPEHERPMAYRQGRFGAFWSCPTKRPDGTWCMHTVQVPQPDNGPAAASLQA